MSDSLGDILYILVMLGVVLIGAIRKRNSQGEGKVLPEDEVHDYPTEAFPPIKQWLEQMEAAKPRTEPLLIPPIPQARIKERETGKGRAKIQGRAATRRPRVSLETTPRMQLKKAAIKEPVIVEENDAEGWFPGEDEQFDLRQAVIYSEILKRPTY